VSKRQKTLFTQAAPEPPPDGDIEYIGQKLPGDFADYILLEPGEYDDPFATPPAVSSDVPPPEPAPEKLPFGIAAYVQELYEIWRPQMGETLAMRRVYRIVSDYHQIEVPHD
jgi:hypothetical protein